MPAWKLTKKGIEWGAAYEEAQPITLTHGRTVVIEAFVAESGDYIITLPDDAKITLDNGYLRVKVGRSD